MFPGAENIINGPKSLQDVLPRIVNPKFGKILLERLKDAEDRFINIKNDEECAAAMRALLKNVISGWLNDLIRYRVLSYHFPERPEFTVKTNNVHNSISYSVYFDSGQFIEAFGMSQEEFFWAPEIIRNEQIYEEHQKLLNQLTDAQALVQNLQQQLDRYQDDAVALVRKRVVGFDLLKNWSLVK